MKESLEHDRSNLMPSPKKIQKNRAFPASEEQTFRLIFEGHSAVMLLIEPETGKIFDANQAALDFYGYSKSKICSMLISEINMLSPESVAVECQKAFSEERNYFVFAHKLASGEVRTVEVYSSPIVLHEKQALFSIVHDVTGRRQMEDNLRQRTDELTSLQATILDLSAPHSLPELLNMIVERAANLLGASGGGLYLTEPEQRKVRCVVSYKTKSDFTGTLLDFGVGAAGYVAETGQPLIIDDYSKWANQANVYMQEQPFHAVMSVPMLWQGQVSGVIHMLRDDISKKFTREELNLLLLFANHAAAAVENARLFSLFDQELNERKQAENLLERTRKNYEIFFNSIDDFLFVLDEHGNIIHVNKTVTDRLEYSPEELFGKSVLMVHPPERRAEAGRIVGEMLAGTAEFCPVPIMKKSGGQIPVETRVTSGFWDGNPVIFGVTKDMSQIKLSEEKFSKAFQSNSALMALSHFEDGTYIDVNDTFLKTLGFSRDEVIGKKSTELYLFANVDQRNTIIEEMKQNGTAKDIEVTIRTKDGSLRDGLFSADTIYIGKDLCLLTVMLDITERKRMEKILQESEEKYRTVANFTYDWEAWHSPDGVCLYISPACERISGYTPAEFLADENLILKIAYPDDKEKVSKHFYAVSHLCRREDVQMDFRIVTALGETRWISHHCTAVYNEEGQCLGRRESNCDITPRKQMEEALRESERFARATVDSIVGEIAILNETGFIVQVNLAWRNLAYAEALIPADVCEGANYLAVCDASQGPDAVYARVVAGGIRSVIEGKQKAFSLEYPCDSEDPTADRRWYNAKVTRFAGDGPIRVVVSHENITARKHAEESLQQQNIYLSALHQITLDLLNYHDMDELLQAIVDRAVMLLDAPIGELSLDIGGELIIQACTRNQQALMGSRVGRGDARLCWQAFDTKQPAIVDDYSTYEYRRSVYADLALHAVADFPVLVREKCIGVLALGRSQPGYIFNDRQVKNGILFAQLIALVLDNVQLFSALKSEIVERKQIEAELRRAHETLDVAHHALENSFEREQRLARTDALTGVNNRRYLFELAEREFNVALRYRPPFSMILFDVDYFKQINDTFGHTVGDLVLKKIAQIVGAEIRSVDVIGRYGGDEFVILLPRTSAQESLPLAERIHTGIAAMDMDTDKGMLKVTISIGIAQTIHSAASESGVVSQLDTVESLFLRADQALYAAKQTGRNCTVIFDQENTKK